MDRVEVTKPVIGLCHMQVCAAWDATDEEILMICNRDNPSGITGGWSKVIREVDEYVTPNMLPIPCASYPKERLHFLVSC